MQGRGRREGCVCLCALECARLNLVGDGMFVWVHMVGCVCVYETWGEEGKQDMKLITSFSSRMQHHPALLFLKHLRLMVSVSTHAAGTQRSHYSALLVIIIYSS